MDSTWAIPALIAVLLIATTIVEKKKQGAIPNAWVLLNLIIAVAVAGITGAWTMLLGGVLLFGVAFVVWQKGAAGGGLVKLSLAIGALLGPIAAGIGVLALAFFTLVLSWVRRNQPTVLGTVPGGITLLALSTFGLGGEWIINTVL